MQFVSNIFLCAKTIKDLIRCDTTSGYKLLWRKTCLMNKLLNDYMFI